jgi:3-phosphoshikimate 1-carboxyvinyltransferase
VRPDPWPAPTAPGPVDALIALPGSKSMTARALVLAAHADQPSRLHGALAARDTRLMAAGLQALGCSVDIAAETWTVEPHGSAAELRHVDCGLAGTVMRFLPPVAALVPGITSFDGDEHARLRPLAPLLDALEQLGVPIESASGHLPIQVHGAAELSGGRVEMDARASSQFVTALLLTGSRCTNGLRLEVGAGVPSRPHIDMTVSMMRQAGLSVHDGDDYWQVDPGRPRGGDVLIEPDLSNAAPFLAAALVTGGSVTVPNWPETTDQPGDDLQRILTALGANVSWQDGALRVSGGDGIRGADLDLGHAGELAPVIAALTALADSPSTLTGLAHLRGHETDRLAALVAEIRRLGGVAEELPDGLRVEPRPLSATVVETYDDHRMAQFAAVIGLSVPGVVLSDVATTAKTLPEFPQMWQALLS